VLLLCGAGAVDLEQEVRGRISAERCLFAVVALPVVRRAR
jgi:hypothetical protein